MSEQASNMQRIPDPPWSLPVAVAEIPDTGRRFDLAADAQTREAVAKVALVLAVPRFNAEFELTRHGRDGLRVVGSVSAMVEQNCVITLEPMQSEIEEAIDLVFAPPRVSSLEHASKAEPKAAGEDFEVLRDGVVDLGAIATEFLILGIDPYPRKPGAIFDAPRPDDEPANRPFAALAAWKKGTPGQGS